MKLLSTSSFYFIFFRLVRVGNELDFIFNNKMSEEGQ
jgi:hypothetical protein